MIHKDLVSAHFFDGTNFRVNFAKALDKLVFFPYFVHYQHFLISNNVFLFYIMYIELVVIL